MSLVGLCSVYLPKDVIGWSVLCDCGISSFFHFCVCCSLLFEFGLCFVNLLCVFNFCLDVLKHEYVKNVLTLSAIELILKRLPPICSQND